MSKDNEYIQQLLSEARSGSRASMGRLAVIIWKRMYPFVFRTTLNHDLTEDILQETLLTVIRQVTSLRERPRFWPWMYRIAWSKIQDNLRRRRVRTSGTSDGAEFGPPGRPGSFKNSIRRPLPKPPVKTCWKQRSIRRNSSRSRKFLNSSAENIEMFFGFATSSNCPMRKSRP